MNSIETKWNETEKILIENKCEDSLIYFIKTIYYTGVTSGINESIIICKNNTNENMYDIKMTKLIIDSLSNAKSKPNHDIKKPTTKNNGTIH